MKKILIGLLMLMCIPAFATPSGLTWIPNTDTQPAGVWHLDSDALIYTNGGATAPFVEEGLLYGLTKNIEVGVDTASQFFNYGGNVSNAVWFNGKIALIPATDKQPFALSVGAYDVSPQNTANAELLYGTAAYTIAGTRFTGGVYQGRQSVIGSDNKGFLVGIDRTIGKWWVSGDYQSGMNTFGCWNAGIGYNLSDKLFVLVGYDRYNAPTLVGAKGSANFQVDINL